MKTITISLNLIILIMLTFHSAYGSNSWDKTDKTMFTNYLFLTAADHIWAVKGIKAGEPNVNSLLEYAYINYGSNGMHIYRTIETISVWYALDNFPGYSRKAILFMLNISRIFFLEYTNKHAKVSFSF